MPGFRDWSARQSKRLRSSNSGTACFLIIAYSFPIVLWIFTGNQMSDIIAEHEAAASSSSDSSSEQGLSRLLSSYVDELGWLIDGNALFIIASMAICIALAAWLQSLSWTAALPKLGLARPTSIEVLFSLASTVPLAILVLLILRPSVEVGPNDDSLGARSLLSFVLSTFRHLMWMGFLYRGLIELAGWSRKRTVLSMLLLASILSTMSIWHRYDYEFDWVTTTSTAATTAVDVLLTLWLFEQWRRRLWILICTSLGTRLCMFWLPFAAYREHGFWVLLIAYMPLVLAVLLTRLVLRKYAAFAQAPARDAK